jgi:hypothetical protein
VSTSTTVTPRRQHGGAATTVQNTDTGHRLRIVRLREADTFRTVYLVTDDGLVQLGTVVMLAPHEGFAHPADGLGPAGWGVDSFAAGAIELDTRIQADQVPSYVLTMRAPTRAARHTHTREAADAR